jgi:type II secretion system protein H
MNGRSGFSLIEMLVVMVLLSVVATFAIPRSLKRSPQSQVDSAARALARDVETVRMRAIAAKRLVRFSVLVDEEGYTAFMDITKKRKGSIEETEEEVRESRLLTRGSVGGVPGVELPRGVKFGSGSVSEGPEGWRAGTAVTLVNGQVEFDAAGMVIPEGSGGVIYLTHENQPAAVAAVTITGAGALRVWRHRNGEWVR